MADDDYSARYANYQFKIDWTSAEPYDPRNVALDVKLLTTDGEVSIANFVTHAFIGTMFEKNRRTGECANGTYFCMPQMVVVEEVSPDVVKRTIDDLIKTKEVEIYFIKYD